MSAPEFKNPIVRWIDYRLPVFTFMQHELHEYPTPKNLNYWWNFGSLAGIVLVILIVTGIVLAMHYTPHATMAFDSVERIMRDVNYGWLIRYVHMNGASAFFIVVYIHIFRGLYFGSYKAPRELLWILGVVILLSMMATAFMGYVLPWGQMSFWGATVITNLFSAIPYVGDWIVTLLALHQHGSNNPIGIDTKGEQDSVPFHPYYTVKDMFGLGVFLIVFFFFVFFAPNFFGEPDNYIEANPLQTPPHIVPEWYFLPFYAILRAFTADAFIYWPISWLMSAKLAGVLAMFASILVLFVLPWLDRSPVKSARYRPLYKQFFWLFVLDCFILGWIGLDLI